MTWLRRPTGWVPGRFSSGMDTEDVLDQISFLTSPPRCIATRVAVQSYATGVAATVQFDTEVVDSEGTAFAPTSDTITIPVTGLWQISYWVTMDTGTTGIRVAEVQQNGSIVLSESSNAPATAGGTVRMNGCHEYLCIANDTIKLSFFQNQGGALNLTGARLAVRLVAS